MSALSHASLAAVHRVLRNGADDFDTLLAEVRIVVQAGGIARVYRMSGGHYDVMRNGCLLLVRNSDGNAVATVDNVAAAILAGDHWLDFDEWSYEDPRGAA